jgi:hypothetical protein
MCQLQGLQMTAVGGAAAALYDAELSSCNAATPVLGWHVHTLSGLPKAVQRCRWYAFPLVSTSVPDASMSADLD